MQHKLIIDTKFKTISVTSETQESVFRYSKTFPLSNMKEAIKFLNSNVITDIVNQNAKNRKIVEKDFKYF